MVKRDLYLNRISSLIDKDIIKIIVGVRRCGKSYMFNLIIEELLKRGIDKENILLINFESAKYRNVSNPRELDLLVGDLTKDIDGKIYMFFDEIQNVDEWEKSINSFRVDYDCDIYLTGSNSKLLSGELATHLAGRYMEIKMYPFSFKEYLDYKKTSPNKKAFADYLIYGGFPFLLSLESEIDKTEYLNDIFNSIFLKDIIERYNIRDAGLLTRIVDFILDNTGKKKSRFHQKQFIIIWITLQMLVFCIKSKGKIWKAKKYCPLMKSIIVLIKVLTKCALAEIRLTTAE